MADQPPFLGDDYDDFECWNCDGEGYVWDCFDGFCSHAEDGCRLCTRRCEICNPKPAALTAAEPKSPHCEGCAVIPKRL